MLGQKPVTEQGGLPRRDTDLLSFCHLHYLQLVTRLLYDSGSEKTTPVSGGKLLTGVASSGSADLQTGNASPPASVPQTCPANFALTATVSPRSFAPVRTDPPLGCTPDAVVAGRGLTALHCLDGIIALISESVPVRQCRQ